MGWSALSHCMRVLSGGLPNPRMHRSFVHLHVSAVCHFIRRRGTAHEGRRSAPCPVLCAQVQVSLGRCLSDPLPCDLATIQWHDEGSSRSPSMHCSIIFFLNLTCPSRFLLSATSAHACG